MVPRIWLYRFLCRNKPYERLITTDSCSPLGCFRPQSVDDGETVCLKQDLTRYWLGHVIGPCDWCPSPLNLEGSRYIHSRDDDEEHGPWTVFNSEESSHYPKADYSDFPIDNQSFGQGRATSKVMLDVGMVCKFEILLGLQQGFDPDDLCVAVHDFDRKPHDLKLKLIELLGKPSEISGITEGITFFHKYHIRRGGQRNFTMKSMVVLFDAELWKQSFHRSHLTVVLMSPEDADPFARRSLRKISAVDYARFYQTK